MSLSVKIGNALLRIMEATGSYRPIPEAEKRVVPREPAPFVGDIPRQAGTEHNQYREEYQAPPEPEEVRDLLYTPRGMGWAGGTLRERYSLQKPVLADLVSPPFPRAKSSIPRGTVVQTQFPNTYGDWVGEYLMTLTNAPPVRPPLLVPSHLMERSYVRRDLAILGLETMVVERPVLVHEALVLPKRHYLWYFTADQVAAYRRAFRIDPPRPRPGSILYLSRQGREERVQERAGLPERDDGRDHGRTRCQDRPGPRDVPGAVRGLGGGGRDRRGRPRLGHLQPPVLGHPECDRTFLRRVVEQLFPLPREGCGRRELCDDPRG